MPWGWGRGWRWGFWATGLPGWARFWYGYPLTSGYWYARPFWPGNPFPFCRWFPWLPRWWWTGIYGPISWTPQGPVLLSQTQQTSPSQPFRPPLPTPAPQPLTKDQEIQYLEEELKALEEERRTLEEEIESLKRRLEQLKSER